MKMLAASIILILTLSAPLASPAAPFESCNCSADDGSCTASVSCGGGCYAYCPNNNNCRAMCLDNSDGGRHGVLMTMAVTLRFKDSSSQEVTTELARITGEQFGFAPLTADAKINLEVDKLPLWDALELLSASGRIQISGDDFSNLRNVRRAFLSGEKISLCAHGVTVKRLVNETRYLTGLNVHIVSGDRNAVVNYTAKGVNINDILAQLSERTGTQIVIK
jgi:hypothetical protein